MQVKKTYKILALLLIMQWAFVQLISSNTTFIEKYYSNGLYLFISNLLRFLLGWIPFSIGDLIYTIIGFFILREIYFLFKEKTKYLTTFFFKILSLGSIMYFLFHFNWGLNYYRNSLTQIFKIEEVTYTEEELLNFTNHIVDQINLTQLLLAKNDSIAVSSSLEKSELKILAIEAYDNLSEEFPSLAYKNFDVKHSIYSLPLTYMGFGGYLNPFTNEAQVNSYIPISTYPATVCHEIAHQIGIASETDANFVGYLASVNSSELFYNYSGYFLALRYCLNEVYRNNPAQYEEVKNKINYGILVDLQNQRDFWLSYQNWSEKYFKLFYDSFLKANKQKDGIKSYSKFVGLLINYYKNQDF